jgi:hypothetical protein
VKAAGNSHHSRIGGRQRHKSHANKVRRMTPENAAGYRRINFMKNDLDGRCLSGQANEPSNAAA